MGIFKSLFGKKKKNKERKDVTSVMQGYFDLYDDKKSTDDGQAQYFKDKSAPNEKAAVSDARAEKASPKKSEKPASSENDINETESLKITSAGKTKKRVQKPKPEKKFDTSEDSNAYVDEENAVKESQKKSGRFEIKKTKDGKFMFNLYALNNVTVATSQTYASSQNAINGIECIIANAAKAPIEDQTVKDFTLKGYPKWGIYIDKAGQYRFTLNAQNGNCIVRSQGYKTKSSCKNGINSIIRCSRNPEIDKSYLKK